MGKLNCSVGDLAITVRCEVPENLGKIVRVIGSKGVIKWSEFGEPMHVWIVEGMTGEKSLVYEVKKKLDRRKSGPCPDQFLRRITPPDELPGLDKRKSDPLLDILNTLANHRIDIAFATTEDCERLEELETQAPKESK